MTLDLDELIAWIRLRQCEYERRYADARRAQDRDGWHYFMGRADALSEMALDLGAAGPRTDPTPSPIPGGPPP